MTIMKQTINLFNLFGAEIRSRSNVDKLRRSISDISNSVMDMTGVVFISRSFADELCILIEQGAKVVNAYGIVESMIDVVQAGRSRKRVRMEEHATVMKFKDMKSLSEYLATIP